jgi:predicted dehydrogenase
MIRFGVIGYGYWGPNIVRNLLSISDVSLDAVCDQDDEALARVRKHHPHLNLYKNYRDVLKSSAIDAVAIITPVSTHYKLAKEALQNGKHIFIEKPFTSSVAQAEELISLAAKKKLLIMVDYTFLFTGAVQKIKQVIDEGMLGDLHYYDSTRVSLGLFQQDVNVIWDLAPHDFAIVDYVIKNKPLALTAHGADHIGAGNETLSYITMYFTNNLIAHFNVNWLSPVKIRTTFIGGEKKMLLWDDLETDEKIRIYDKGVERKSKEGIYKLRVDYRAGDMHSPRVSPAEALYRELTYFVDCVKNQKTPINDGFAGCRVVQWLEVCNESLKKNGKLIKLTSQWQNQKKMHPLNF